MNTRKLLFGLFAFTTLAVASCTSSTTDAEVYENSVRRDQITKGTDGVRRDHVRKGTDAVRRDHVRKGPDRKKN